MGSIFSSASLTTSGSTEFAVSAAAVSKVFRDLEAAPSFIPHLLSLSITRGGAPFRSERNGGKSEFFAGRRVTMLKSVTNIKQDPYSVCVSVDFKGSDWDKKYAAETFTVVIQPVDGDKSCHVIWTMAYVPAGFFGTIGAWVCRRCLLSSLQEHIDEEMYYYAKEASRRAVTLKAETVKADL